MSEKVLLALSPVFAALAGWLVVLAAKYLPGHPHLDAGQLTAVFIAGGSWMWAHLLLRAHNAHKARLAAARPPPSAPQPEPVTLPVTAADR